MTAVKRISSDGATTVYTVDFPLGYLKKEDIQVYAEETPNIQLSYSWIGNTQIELTTALPLFDVFYIRRVTASETVVNDYTDAVAIRESELDDSFLQPLLLIEERKDDVTEVSQRVTLTETRLNDVESDASTDTDNIATNSADIVDVKEDIVSINNTVAGVEADILNVQMELETVVDTTLQLAGRVRIVEGAGTGDVHNFVDLVTDNVNLGYVVIQFNSPRKNNAWITSYSTDTKFIVVPAVDSIVTTTCVVYGQEHDGTIVTDITRYNFTLYLDNVGE